MMRMFNILTVACLVHLWSLSAYGKGLDELTPGQSKGKDDASAKRGQKPGSNGKKGKAEPTEVSPGTDRVPTKAWALATSFGWAGVSSSEGDWRAAGMSDLTFMYKLPTKALGESLFVSGRYAPMDVAPVFSKDGESREYVGTVQGFHVGAIANFRFTPKMVVSGSAELGLMFSSLKDELNLADAKIADETGINVSVGGAAEWQILPGIELGPKLYIGFGSFTTYQFAGSASFAF